MSEVTVTPGHVVAVREDMDMKAAFILGQVALDEKDKHIRTTTIDKRRFPTYESNPTIERTHQQFLSQLRTEVDVAVKHNKQADIIRSREGIFVTKPIRKKYPVLYTLARIWMPIRDGLLQLTWRVYMGLRKM